MNAKAFIIFQFQFLSLLQFVTLSFLIVVKRLREPVTKIITASIPAYTRQASYTMQRITLVFLSILIHLTTPFFLQVVIFTSKTICPIAADNCLSFHDLSNLPNSCWAEHFRITTAPG